MKAKVYKLIIIVGILLIAGLVFALKQFNKPLIDMKNSKPDYIVSAKQIIKDFLDNETQASEKYTGKVIQITGKVSDITTNNNGLIVLSLDTGEMSGIRCQMLPENNKESFQLNIGDEVHVKGTCTGFLLDLLLVRCVMTNS